MSQKWTTLVEEQTDKANEAISNLLDGKNISPSERRNKTIAVLMAAVGVVLIGAGLYPFLGSGLEANLVGEEEQNIFADPVSVDVVEDDIPENILDTDTPDQTAESKDDLDAYLEDFEGILLPVDAGSEDSELLPENIFEPEDFAEEFVPEEDFSDLLPLLNSLENADSFPEEEVFVFENTTNETELFPAAPLFAQNTHTGSTAEPLILSTGSPAPAVTTGNVYAAAGEEMADAGPAEWVAIVIALCGALLLRKRKLFRGHIA